MKLLSARRSPACMGVAARVVAAAWLSIAHSAALADEPAGTLTLAQAVAATLQSNPDLAVGAYELRAADARSLQAGLRPNPELSVEVGGLMGSGLARDADEKQATLTLGQVLELGDKRTRRMSVAQSDHSLQAVEQRARELDALAEVTRRFIDVLADQEQVASSQDALALATQTQQAIAVRVQAARTPEGELSRARIAVARARMDVRQAQGVLEGARRSLAAMWGGTGARFDKVQADLYALPALESFDALLRHLDRNPDFERFASEARLRDAELRLAQAQSRPNLTLSAGIRRFQSTGDVGLVVGFSLPLQWSDRNQGAIAEARVRREQTRAGEQAARLRVQARLFALYQQIQAGRDQLDALRTEAIPLARAALDQTQYGYDRGRFSYLELAAAQQDLLGLRVAAIQAAADIHRLINEIERLTGQPLAAGIAREDAP